MIRQPPLQVFSFCHRLRNTHKPLSALLLLVSIFIVLFLFNFGQIFFNIKLRPRASNEKEKLIKRHNHGATSVGISPPAGGKNIMVVHIGPPKTGTTSIQNTLAYLDATGVLANDNFHYIGKINREMEDIFPLDLDIIRPLLGRGPKAWFQPSRSVHNETIKNFKHSFDELHANHNVIISAEDLSLAVNMGNASANFYTDLQKMIPPEQYHVHFIIMYRRYLQRLLSHYHFENNPHWYEGTRWEEWPCHVARRCGIHIKTFREYYHDFIKPIGSKWDPHPKTMTSLSLYKDFKSMSPKNWSMHVYNTHHPESSSDVVVNLLCGMGDFAAHTCNYLRSANSTNALLNYSNANVDMLKQKDDIYVVDYRLMAQNAYYRRSIHKNITRRQSELAFREKFQEWKGERQAHVYREGETIISSWNGGQDMTIPLACLSQNEWNDIMSESENIESSLLHEFYESTDGKESLRRQLQEIKESHALCNIDLEIMFHNDTYWVDFLDCLRVSQTVPKCL